MESPESDNMMCIEVQVNSVVQCEDDKFISPQTTPEKPIKRVSYGYTPPKRTRQPDSSQESACEPNDNCLPSSKKKMKKTSRHKKSSAIIDPEELKNVLEDMNEEIDSVLEETADRTRLTATNVKSILRHVITNEYVLAMVRNTMKAENNEEDLEEAPFEPKLTRSRVKELRQKQHMLPWPMSTPVKQAEPETQALLEEEFSDENSSDEDYKPNEEECHSEDDINSPKTGELDSSFSEKPPSVATKPEEDPDDDIRLVIALPPEQESVPAENEVDNIALRTRSKLPLNDTPLETIEATLVAPDITVDMYDTQCDNEEWQKFLQELSKPLDALFAVEKPDEEQDDPEEDPEYNALEDEDVPDELDFRFDNSMKITRKELNALMAEIYDYDESLFNRFDEDEEEVEPEAEPEPEASEEKRAATPISEEVTEPERSGWSMTAEERLQLEHQMRIYVQILTQSFLLSSGIPELNYINLSSKLFLDEIKMFASRGSSVNAHSAFYAHNLDGALDIINEYENGKQNNIRSNNKFGSAIQKGHVGIPSYQVKKTLLYSKVFIYPELLPKMGFKKHEENVKVVFTRAEDNLIAFGLDEFSFAVAPIYYINLFLVPNRTEEQIKIRIKNSKGPKVPLENPIKYYFVHKKSPPVPRTIEFFDPDKVKAPKDHPLEVLPRWARQILMYTMVPRILPKKPKPAIAPPIVLQPPLKPRLRKLLPRRVHYSPLKQISPILKKYNQQRYPSLSTDHLYVKKTPIKSPSVSPIPKRNLRKILKKETPEDDKMNSCSKTDSDAENGDVSVLIDGTVKKSLHNEGEETRVENGEISGPVELDVTDEGDEEAIDDEQEVSPQHASSLTSSAVIKKHSVMKKKNKQQRDLESSLALLQPNLVNEDPKKEERESLFVNSYLLRVTEALKKDPTTCEKFLRTLCKHQHSSVTPVKLYLEIKETLKDYPTLADDFVAFLNAEQAKECGKYKEHLTLSKIRKFIRKVEVHFKNQPQHLMKILKVLAQFRQQSSITSSDVMAILQPLLKNQSHLMEELIILLPGLAPPQSLMTDFEEVTIPNSDDDNSSVSSCEDIQIPEAPDPYGGKDCPCECHTSPTESKFLNKLRHCVSCGVKFMDGRVYIQTGKVLKPAHVVYYKEAPQPVKTTTDDAKTSTKNKQSSCSPAVISDQSSKLEVSQPKKSPVLTQPPVAPSNDLQLNKDPTPASVVTSSPVVPPEDPVPSSSKLPCDVIEDTVFPAVPVASNKKNVPQNFSSQLKQVIVPSKDNDVSPNKTSELNTKTGDKSVENQPPKEVNQAVKWRRDEDKLLIYNCQRLGLTENAFRSSAETLKRTPEEVKERFLFIMKLLSKELDVTSKESKQDTSAK